MPEFTAEAMREMVAQQVRLRRCDEGTAMGLVAASITGNMVEMKGWWTAFGAQMVAAIIAPGRAAETSVSGAEPTSEQPAPAPLRPPLEAVVGEMSSLPTQVRTRTQPRPSWRTRAGVSPMEMVLPVGLTGTKKRLGDFNREDALHVRQMYADVSVNAGTLANAWGGLADRLEGGRTLEDIADDLHLLDLGITPNNLGVANCIRGLGRKRREGTSAHPAVPGDLT